MINLLPFIFLLLFDSGKSIDINNCNRLWGMSNTVGNIDIYKIDIYMCINDPYDIYKQSHQNTFIQDNLIEHKNISNNNNTNVHPHKLLNDTIIRILNISNITHINNITNHTYYINKTNVSESFNESNSSSYNLSASPSSLISPSPSSLISPSPSSLISPSPSSLLSPSPSSLLSPSSSSLLSPSSSLSPSPTSFIIKNETNNITSDDLTETELFKKQEEEEVYKEKEVDTSDAPVTVLIVLISVLIVMFSVFVIVYACKKYKQVEDENVMNNYEDDTPRTKVKKIQQLGWYKKTFKDELKNIDKNNNESKNEEDFDVKKQVEMDIAKAREKFNRGRNKLKVTYKPKTIPVDSPRNTVIDINENARATPPIPMKQNVSEALKNKISQNESKNDADGDLL